MTSKNMTDIKIKKKSSGVTNVKRPRINATPINIPYTGYVTICCGRAYLSEESYNRHAMEEEEHSAANQWNDIIMKQPFVQIKKMSLAQRKNHLNKGRIALVKKHRILKKSLGFLKKCHICKAFVHGSNLKRHMKNAHVLNSKHKCIYCACVYSSRKAMLLHCTKTHPEHISARKLLQKSANIPADGKIKKLPHKLKISNESKQFKKGVDVHECIFCGKIFNSKLSFQHHLLDHIGDKPYSCQICEERFETTNELTQHIKDLHPNLLKYFCDICPGLFYHTNEQLARHREITHSGPSNSNITYDQTNSDDESPDYDDEDNDNNELHNVAVGVKKVGNKNAKPDMKSSAVMKMKSIRVDDGYKCPICGLILKELAYYRSHRLTHTDIYPYQCTQCDAKFRTNGNCKSHMSSSHVEGGEFGCDECACVFGTGQGLTHHKWIYHADDNKKGKLGAGLRNLKRQNELVIKAKKVKGFYIKNRHDMSNKEGGFPCDICGKILKSQISYDGHMLIHSNQFPVKCVQCGATFRLRRALIKHRQTSHVEGGEFSCSLCPCTFASIHSLSRHATVYHTGKYNCAARMDEERDSIKHSEQVSKYPNRIVTDVHRGDDGFECSICGKFLKSKLTYNGHMLIHLKKFPYKCKQCGVKFRLRSTLDRHVKTNHVANGEYQCYLCPCTFDLHRGLQRHLHCYHSGKRNTDGKAKVKKSPNKPKIVQNNAAANNRLYTSSSSRDSNYVTENSDTANEYGMEHLQTEIVDEDDSNNIQGIKMEEGYMCGLCGKILKNLNCFRQHRLIHFDSATHECPKCDQKFRTSSNRNAHLKRAHVKNGFKCTQCPCEFLTLMSLTSHNNLIHPKE